MRDYKVYLPHHRDQRAGYLIDLASRVAAGLTLVVVMALMAKGCVDAVVHQAEVDEELARLRWVAQGYERPLAYRLSTPTFEQMEHLEHLRQVAQVRR